MTRAVLFFIFVLHASAFYEKVDFIDTNLNQQTFGETVLRSPGVWVVEFYAPWCQHCKNFQSDFQMAAENLKGLVHFGAIDCDVEELKPLCGHFKIESLPTVLAFKPFLEPIEIEGQKGLTKKPVKYQGALKPAALAKWAANFLADPVDPLIDIVPGNLDAFLGQDRTKLKGLLFSEKEKKSNLMRAVALNFRIEYLSPSWLPIGQVSHTNKDIVDRYGITSFPSLIIVDENGDKIDTFSGQFTVSECSSFLAKHAYTPTEEDLQPKQTNQQQQKKTKNNTLQT